MGKETEGWKNQKKKKIEDITLLKALKSNIQSLQHYSILFKPKYYLTGGIWGKNHM